MLANNGGMSARRGVPMNDEPRPNEGAKEKPDKLHEVHIVVNEKEVAMPDKEATGREIKEAAIAQGVSIGLDFVLSEEIGERKSRVVGDDDKVRVHNNQ